MTTNDETRQAAPSTCPDCGATPGQEHAKTCYVNDLERRLWAAERKLSDSEPVPVYVAWQRVRAECPVITKDHTAPSQMGGFAFRGIEDADGLLDGLLAKHGVFYLPSVDAIERYERQGERRVMFETRVHCVLTVYGPAGDKLTLDAWGEAVDTGDKGVAKATTNARKIALLAALSKPTQETAETDTDRAVVDETVPVADPERHEHLAETIRVANERGQIPEGELSALARQFGRKHWPLTVELMEAAEHTVAQVIAENTPPPKSEPEASSEPGEEPFDPVPGVTPGVAPSPLERPYDMHKVGPLRAELRRRKLDDQGRKDQLVERLREHDAAQLNASDA